MPAEIITSDRLFQIWNYTVSHCSLLLRSTKSDGFPDRNDSQRSRLRTWRELRSGSNTYSVNLWGLYATENSQGPFALVNALKGEASAADASQISITGNAVVNQGLLNISPGVAGRLGLQFQQINPTTILLQGAVH